MKKFDFGLKFLLDHRKRLEEGCHTELVELVRDLDRVKGVLESCRREYEACEVEFRQRQREGMGGGEIPLYSAFLKKTGVRLQELEETTDLARTEVARKRGELAELAKQRQVMEKLREKAFFEYKKIEARDENKALDETSVQKFGRGN